MEELFIALIQFFFEILLDVLLSAGWDWGFGEWNTPASRTADTGHTHTGILAFFALLAGAGIGWITLCIHRDLLLPSSAWRLANLLLAPAVALVFSLAVSGPKRVRDTPASKWPRAISSATFALGLVAMRLAYGHHH